jgi:hypothetical protein
MPPADVAARSPPVSVPVPLAAGRRAGTTLLRSDARHLAVRPPAPSCNVERDLCTGVSGSLLRHRRGSAGALEVAEVAIPEVLPRDQRQPGGYGERLVLPGYDVSGTEYRGHAERVLYVPSDLQDPRMFKPRNPLLQTARRGRLARFCLRLNAPATWNPCIALGVLPEKALAPELANASCAGGLWILCSGRGARKFLVAAATRTTACRTAAFLYVGSCSDPVVARYSD